MRRAPGLLLAPLVLVLALAPASRAEDAAAPVSSRDWSRSPAVVQLETTSDVYAVGDVHGDDERLLALLAASRIVKKAARPEDLEWTAGTSVLVFTGDLIDKGPHSLVVLAIARSLETRAAAAGGRVIVLLGNHEVELLAGREGKNEGLRQELAAAKIPLASVLSGAHELGAWLRTRPLAARVNDWFFAHAGKTDGRTIPELEAALRKAIDADGFGAGELLRADSLVEARLKPAPWWEVAGEKPEATLDRLLSALGAKHLVIGHQPGHIRFADGTARAKGTLFQKYGRVFLIDTGMSRGVGDGEGALLRIHKTGTTTEAQALAPDGSATALWRE